jgi:hypothetical protein
MPGKNRKFIPFENDLREQLWPRIDGRDHADHPAGRREKNDAVQLVGLVGTMDALLAEREQEQGDREHVQRKQVDARIPVIPQKGDRKQLEQRTIRQLLFA